MSVFLSPIGCTQFLDGNGKPLTGGKLYTYIAGTTTPQVTYTSATGSIFHTNPIILDAAGRVPGSGAVWLTDNRIYKFVVKSSADVLQSTWDNISGINDVVAPNASSVEYAPPFVGALTSNYTVQDRLAQCVSVKDFGAVGNGIADDTNAIQLAINTGKPIHIPAGVYLYSALVGLNGNNLTILGDGSNCTVLKCKGSGIALDIGTTSGFRQGVNISGLTVEGNSNTTIIIRATAIARSMWSDINVREANRLTGVGFVFRGCMLNHFESLVCSQDRNSMTNVPLEAFNIEALSPYGNSSNNTWVNLYAEGAGNYSGVDSINIGVRISGGTQNVFISGSPESCKTWGLLISADSRSNTFIGTGFENLNATGGDFADGGKMTRYINCYGSQKVVLQGELLEIEGGYYERIQIDQGAIRNTVHDLIINHWSTGAGGLYDSGTGTTTKNIYDADIGAYATDIFPRFLMALRSDQNNITGAGNAYTMAWDTLIDDNNNCNGVSFTAPVKGRYQLACTLTLKNLESTATEISMEIRTTGGSFVTARRVNLPASGGIETITVSGLADLNVGNTAYVIITITGMPGNTVDAIGNSTNRWCTFSGYQVH